jgi:enoyl-CoA hydratase
MVAPRAELMQQAMELARTIGRKSQLAVRMALKAVHITQEANLTDGLQLEASLFGICCASEDAREGTSAFLEKRQPVFNSRKNG